MVAPHEDPAPRPDPAPRAGHPANTAANPEGPPLITFMPATKEKAKARVALDGPAGAGKTFTALRLAVGLAGTDGRIALLDTEHGSASKYASRHVTDWRQGKFRFDTSAIASYDPRVLIEALDAAVGYDVFIVDSLSHFWMGVDGMLEQVDRSARRSYGGNSFGGWKEAAPMERRMIEAMLAFPGHLIATMRTKTEWVIEQNDKGKAVPRRVGLKAVQRDGIEFEFDVVGDMDLENNLLVSKTRCPALNGQVINRPGEDDLAKTLLEWLEDGVDLAVDVRDRALAANGDVDTLRALYIEARDRRRLDASVQDDTGETVTLRDLLLRLAPPPRVPPPTDPSPARQELDRMTDRVAASYAAEPAADVSELADERTLTRLHAAFSRHGINDREQKLSFCMAVIDRNIASTGELTRNEVVEIMRRLAADAADAEVPA